MKTGCKIHYIEWRPTDFLASRISRRPFFEQGVERMIAAIICQNGGPVALGEIEIEDIAHRGRCGEDEVKNAIDELVGRGILNLSDDLYMIPWLVEEIERVGNRARVAIENGKKRGKNTPSGTQQEPSGFPVGSQSEPSGFPTATHAGNHHHNPLPSLSQSTITNPITPSGTTGGGGGDEVWIPKPTPEAVAAASAWQHAPNLPAPIDHNTGSTAGKPQSNPHACTLYANGTICTESPAFSRFWGAYPKQAKKPAAADAWNRAILAGADPEHIIAGVAADPGLRKSPEDMKYLPAATDWLNDSRWTCTPNPTVPERPPRTADDIQRDKENEAKHKRSMAMRKAEGEKIDAIWARDGMRLLTANEQQQIRIELEQEFGA